MVRLPTAKLTYQLESCRAAVGDRIAFLSFSGALSPVHTQHMRAMEVARAALKRDGWSVVAGFLAPTGDEYVKEKLGVGAWNFDTRVRLCEIACGESEWIDVCAWGEYRSYRLCAALNDYLKHDRAPGGRMLKGIELMGSDVVIRILDQNIADWDIADPIDRNSWYRDRVICCLVRPGPNSAGELEHIKKYTARRAADLGTELIVIDPEYIYPALEPVSSTEIRKLLQAGDIGRLRALGWLHPRVLAALEDENLAARGRIS